MSAEEQKDKAWRGEPLRWGEFNACILGCLAHHQPMLLDPGLVVEDVGYECGELIAHLNEGAVQRLCVVATTATRSPFVAVLRQMRENAGLNLPSTLADCPDGLTLSEDEARECQSVIERGKGAVQQIFTLLAAHGTIQPLIEMCRKARGA